MSTHESQSSVVMDERQATAFYRLGANVFKLTDPLNLLARRQHSNGARAAMVALGDISMGLPKQDLTLLSPDELATKLDDALDQIQSAGWIPLTDDFVGGFNSMRDYVTASEATE